jgi:hypothetical protein
MHQMYTTVREVPLSTTTAPGAMPAPGEAALWLDVWNGDVALVLGWASDDGRGIRFEYPDPFLLGLTPDDLVLAARDAGADLSVSGRSPVPAGLSERVLAALNQTPEC